MPIKKNRCGKCTKVINKALNFLRCHFCNCSYHVRCGRFNSFAKYQNTDKKLKGWVCNTCVNTVFPFATVTDQGLTDLLCKRNNKYFDKPKVTPVDENCHKCDVKFKTNSVRCLCYQCKHKYHLKCQDHIKYRAQYEKIDKRTAGWLCNECSLDAFPLMTVDDDEFEHMSLGLVNSSFLKDLRETYQFENQTDSLSDQNLNWITNLDSKYYEVGEFEKFMIKTNENKKLSMIHFNTVNLANKHERISELLAPVIDKLQVIAVSETQLKDGSNIDVSLPGFHEIITDNSKTSYGGVGLYIAESISNSPRDDLKIDLSKCENVWVELTDSSNNKKTIIGVIYRHPNNDTKEFQEKLEKTLEKINKENKNFFILGDINIDLKHCMDHNGTKSYIDMLFSNLCMPVITKPTRVNLVSQTIIDHCYTNYIESNIVTGIIQTDISDHFPIFLSADLEVPKLPKERKQIRDYRQFDSVTFANDVKNAINIDNKDDVNCYYDSLMAGLNELADIHAPIRTQSIKQARLEMKPWITPGLLTSIRKKNKLYHTHFINGTSAQRVKFKEYNNTLTRLKEQSKRDYLKQKFDEVKGNMKKSWQLVNETIQRKSKRARSNKFISKITDKNDEYTTPNEISNKFNHYFRDVGPSLASKIKDVNKTFSDYLGNPIESNFFTAPTNAYEVRELIWQLEKNKSLGLGDVPIKLIKAADAQISEHLANIFNLSFESGEFPKGMKTSKIIPLHKGGLTTELKNYRPISLLPIFSKILERLMFNRLIKHLIENDILFPYQFGFRKGYSTTLALAEITQNIYENLMKKQTTCGVFLDLSKAFDTIDHRILMKKLHHYGIRGIALKWFESYLSDRKQHVYVNNFLSEALNVICGVPQGSILGPLLFLIYVNDISKSSDKLLFRLFADDTNIFMSDSNVGRLQTAMNTELKKVNQWLKCNFLSLNVSKTKFLLFHYNNDRPQSFHVNINGNKIEKCTFVKYLGVFIDDKLNFKHHIDTLCTKISKMTGILSKLRHYANLDILKQVYYGLIYPHLIYGILVWGNSNTSRLQNKQNKIVNIMHFSNHGKAFDPLSYKRSNLIKLIDIRHIQSALFIYDFKTNNLPHIFDNYFIPKQREGLSTRGNENNYYQEFYKTKYANLCIKTACVKAWANVPISIKDRKSRLSFKKQLQRHILRSYAVNIA